jgi:hypothetical protein
MTLNTRIWLHGPIHGRAAFNRALSAIMCAVDRVDEIASAQIRESSPNPLGGYSSIHTVIGQGLPGIVDCDYREDGSPLATEDVYSDDEDDVYEDGTRWIDQRKCQAELSWDTAYGYQENGLSCSMLHAKALILLYESLPDDVTLTWQNEYTGDIFDGLDGLDSLLG